MTSSIYLKKHSLYLGRLAGGVRKQARDLARSLTQTELGTLMKAARILDAARDNLTQQARAERRKEDEWIIAQRNKYIAAGREYLRGLDALQAVEKCEALSDYIKISDPFSPCGYYSDLQIVVQRARVDGAISWPRGFEVIGLVLEALDHEREMSREGFEELFLPGWKARRAREAVIDATPNVVRLKA